jgi:hypothetical protein
MVLPLSEVADITRPQFRSPRFIGAHHCVITTDREHDGLLALPLLFESRSDFGLNPIALFLIASQASREKVTLRLGSTCTFGK